MFFKRYLKLRAFRRQLRLAKYRYIEVFYELTFKRHIPEPTISRELYDNILKTLSNNVKIIQMEIDYLEYGIRKECE